MVEDGWQEATKVRPALSLHLFLEAVHGGLEVVVRDVHDDGAEHVQEAAVRVHGEALAEGPLHGRGRHIVEAQVQHLPGR